MSVSVLVVDDHVSFRAVMREVVAAASGFELAGEAASGTDALNFVEENKPQVVVVDKRMPDASGIEICRAITARHPDIIVVLCSVEDLDLQVAQECGAARAVHKQHLSPQLLADVWRTYHE
jgi:two-component system, NarL family, invasion response regulator UvrY